jgi:CheY-like chemotaxis protein
MGASLDVSGLPRLARPLRVLLVEDDASIREGLNKLVNTLGHRAHVTQNVREAPDLAVSENVAFDLLLSDISLPDGDGWELFRWRSSAPASDCDERSVQHGRFGQKPDGRFRAALAQTLCAGNR